jgi:hypothetical protein
MKVGGFGAALLTLLRRGGASYVVGRRTRVVAQAIGAFARQRHLRGATTRQEPLNH